MGKKFPPNEGKKNITYYGRKVWKSEGYVNVIVGEGMLFRGLLY